MEAGFSDACVALCMGETPIARIAQTCRAAAVEMPRPTVRKWCEHGYNVAFKKTRVDLATHFHQPEPEPEPVVEEPEAVQEEEVVPEAEEVPEQAEESIPEPAVEEVKEHAPRGKVIATVPITLDEEELILSVFEGQTAEDSVVSFCRENVADDVASCIRQLLPTVLERLENLGA